jgi:hypothetical protein
MTLSLHTIRRLYAERRPEGHWFDASTMRWFKTRLPRNTDACIGNVSYFVTSEQSFYSDSPRLYTVRSFDHDTGEIDTVGEFNTYRTAAHARAAIRKMVSESTAKAAP